MSQGHHQTSRGSGVSFVPKPLAQGYGAGARRPSAADQYMSQFAAQQRASGTQSLPELSKRGSDAARRSLGAPPVIKSGGYHPAFGPGSSNYAVLPQSAAAAATSPAKPAAAELEPELAAASPQVALPSPNEPDTPGFGADTPGFGAETPGFGKVSPAKADPLIARMNVVVEDEDEPEPGYAQDQRSDGWSAGGMSPLTPGALAGFGARSPKVEKRPIPKPDQETKLAIVQIREKLNAVTEGGPGGLRRSFRVFDRNGDGSIDHREFDKVLRRYLNLRFEKHLIEKVMAQFDDTGDGEIDFRKFSELVVGSDSRSQTSLTVGNSQIKGRSNVVSDDAGNSDMMVRRKITMSFKALRASFRDLVDNQGKISRDDLTWVLSRYDVDLIPAQFEALMTGGGARSATDGITWAGFAEYYRRQEEEAKALSSDANKLSEIKNVSVRNCVEMIREKINGIMEGGPDGLRRAFRVFDSDMSGGKIASQYFASLAAVKEEADCHHLLCCEEF
jgi:Ca2+-binding EF-hand superfamily protein